MLVKDQNNLKIGVSLGVLATISLFLGKWEAFVENCYTVKIYPLLSEWLRTLSGIFPFNIGDWLYVSLILLILWKLFQRKWISAGIWIISAILVFQLFWGINYYRKGIASQLKLSKATYSRTEINALTHQLIDSANYYRNLIGKGDIKKMTLDQLVSEAQAGYQQASLKFPFLSIQIKSVKNSWLTPVADYIGFTGYYIPFTGEANLRDDLPAVLNPYIVCHEVAHQLGYASESEASFVGLLAAEASSNPTLKYSLYLDLLGYAFYEQYLLSAELPYAEFEHLMIENRKRMDTLVKQDRKAIRDFFDQRKNAISPISNELYDQFLKLQQQAAGIKSYNEIIAWYINYQKTKS
ncbi:MAG: hypothetical protein RI983_862 [Bacteroidota bacterium]|jgi:hypothetical protein